MSAAPTDYSRTICPTDVVTKRVAVQHQELSRQSPCAIRIGMVSNVFPAAELQNKAIELGPSHHRATVV